MAEYKCIWCKDKGEYFPLHGPSEPCRECAAFVKSPPTAKLAFPPGAFAIHVNTSIGPPKPSNVLLVTQLSSEQKQTVRQNIPYSGSGWTTRLGEYVATEVQHVPRILEVLGWDAWDARLAIDDGKWIMKHALQGTPQ